MTVRVFNRLIGPEGIIALLAGVVIGLMFSGGLALEELASARARRELTALVERAPKRARIHTDEGLRDVPVDQVEGGDVAVARTGEVVPVDGTMISAKTMLCVITGIMTFSSSYPAYAAMATVVSSPMAWKQTWFTISAIDGFTLPGMMLEPGWTAGSRISARPVRGPEARSRMSLAILLRSRTYARSAPLSVATSPIDCMSWTRSPPSRNSSPDTSRRYLIIRPG